MPNLAVNLAGLALKNPVLTASGTFGFGREYAEFYDLSLLGGVVVKGTTLEKKQGNPPPRIAESVGGLLNSVGLQNPGVEAVIATELPFLRQYDTAKIVNIAGATVDQYRAVAEKISASGLADALEVNISCPNVKAGGMAFGTDPVAAGEITRAVRAVTRLPIFLKLSPNVTDIVPIAKACEAEGADGISLINTISGLVIDLENRRPFFANKVAGMSGPALKPVALRFVWQASRAVKIPVIGLGGIMTGQDALEFMLAGATAVQIGSANFYDPVSGPRIVQEMEQWLQEHKVADVRELIGALAE